jgi:hypothetical protein
MFNIRLDAAWFNSRFAVAAGQALLGSLFVVSGLLKLANPMWPRCSRTLVCPLPRA